MTKYFTIIALFFAFFYVSHSEDKKADTLKVYKIPSITVTTTYANEGKSPVPFSEIKQAELENIYTVKDIPEILSELPSLISYSQNGNAIGYSTLTMRGFDQRRISVLINGIPQNDPEDQNVYWIDFPDITSSLDNIQVQRGAGLMNYGAAAIGGSINLTTSDFINQTGVKIYSGIGYQEYGASGTEKFQPTTSKYSMEISSGKKGNYAFYGRLSKIQSSGYRDYSWTNLNSYFLSAVRFDDNFTTQINIFGGPFSDGLAYIGVPKSYVKDLKLRRLNLNDYWTYNSTGDTVNYLPLRRKQEHEEFSQPHYELLNDWQINEKLIFKSSIFYYSGDGFFDFSDVWADAATLRIDSAHGFYPTVEPSNTIIRAVVENKHGGWIPRIIWKHTDGELTAGAEIRLHRSNHYGKIQYSESLPAGFDPDYKFYSYNGGREAFSIFAREQYKLNEELTLNVEAQLVRQSYRIYNEKAGNLYTEYITISGDTITNGADIFNINYIFFNPRLGANYKIDKHSNIYFLAAYTSREPRMANLYSAEYSYYGDVPLFAGYLVDNVQHYDFSKPLIKPESMFDFELGANTRQDYFNININFYWMEYFDELVKSGRLDVFGNPIDGNAPRTRHYGVEIQGAVNILKGTSGNLSLSANATYSKNEIIDYHYITSNQEKISLKGNSIAGFPDFLSNIRLTYKLDGFWASISGKYVGSYRTDNFDDLLTTNQTLISDLQQNWYGYYKDNTLDAYTVFNTDLSYTFENILSLQHLKIHAQINNIFNNIYAAGAEGKDFFPAAERNFFFGLEIGL